MGKIHVSSLTLLIDQNQLLYESLMGSGQIQVVLSWKKDSLRIEAQKAGA
ncbi:MAG: hypothetical protein H7A24_11215 [Leptospiraceae bacterium]|nr:hypothetical protein [Leptospiraceae bacterium]MCP5512443.1 hypothetical protein [Leptospiraceae bacterium]